MKRFEFDATYSYCAPHRYTNTHLTTKIMTKSYSLGLDHTINHLALALAPRPHSTHKDKDKDRDKDKDKNSLDHAVVLRLLARRFALGLLAQRGARFAGGARLALARGALHLALGRLA